MPAINIANGTIDEISRDRGNTLATVSYLGGWGRRQTEETIRLVIGSRTLILNENGNPVPANALRVGMTVNASVSSAMTRSIPPQTTAYIIRILRRQQPDEVTIGNIIDVDRNNSNFTIVTGRDAFSRIRCNVSPDTLIFDKNNRMVNFSRLMPGMRVRVRHARFMTASIPPQTTAFEVRML